MAHRAHQAARLVAHYFQVDTRGSFFFFLLYFESFIWNAREFNKHQQQKKDGIDMKNSSRNEKKNFGGKGEEKKKRAERHSSRSSVTRESQPLGISGGYDP